MNCAPSLLLFAAASASATATRPTRTIRPPPPHPISIIPDSNNQKKNRTPCLTCGKETGSISRKMVGSVAIAWCCCLFWTIAPYGPCLIPLCCDDCKDTELICFECQIVKNKIPANCC